MTPRLTGQVDEEKWGPIKIIRVDPKGRGTLVSKYRGDIDRYRQLLRANDAEINLFICWENWMVDTAVPIFMELRGKKVMASHGTSVFWRPPGLKGWIRRILWVTYKKRYIRFLPKFDFFILLTELAQKTRFYDKILLDNHGYKNWVVISNGTNWHLFAGSGADFRNQYHLGTQLIVLYVANYHWGKNHVALIRAFQEAQLKNATLVLIGSEMNGYGRRLQQRYGGNDPKRDRLLFLSNLSQEAIREAYCAADFFVCPSLTEAQPLVILDAMASGTPFLSMDVGCIAELPGGMVARNESELVKFMQFLARDEEARKRLGAIGRKACIEKYNWEKVAREYDRIFEHLLA